MFDDSLPRSRRGSVSEGRSDRSLARSAWTAPPQKSRPVGYGLIRAGVRTDSMIDWPSLKNTAHLSTRNTSGIRSVPDHTVPYATGRSFGVGLFQALRARLRSCSPSGTRLLSRGKHPARRVGGAEGRPLTRRPRIASEIYPTTSGCSSPSMVGTSSETVG
jgi:hypothetical protein